VKIMRHLGYSIIFMYSGILATNQPPVAPIPTGEAEILITLINAYGLSVPSSPTVEVFEMGSDRRRLTTEGFRVTGLKLDTEYLVRVKYYGAASVERVVRTSDRYTRAIFVLPSVDIERDPVERVILKLGARLAASRFLFGFLLPVYADLPRRMGVVSGGSVVVFEHVRPGTYALVLFDPIEPGKRHVELVNVRTGYDDVEVLDVSGGGAEGRLAGPKAIK
jgi:hypothetical protein